jgi:hypothetical protein
VTELTFSAEHTALTVDVKTRMNAGIALFSSLW